MWIILAFVFVLGKGFCISLVRQPSVGFNFPADGNTPATSAPDALNAGLSRQQVQIVTGVCICVPTGSCALAGGSTNGSSITNDGSGLIDIRIVNNPNLVSNVVPLPTGILTPAGSGITPTIISQTTCTTGLERCCPATGYNCGIRYPPVSGSRQPTPGTGQAQYGAYPWQAVILSPGDVFVGTGAIIDNFNILTVAHRVANFVSTPTQLKIRVGEWDAATNTETLPVLEYFVNRITLNPNFNNRSLRNSVAILRVSTSIILGQYPTISTACLSSGTIGSGSRCWVSGWGRNDFTAGQFQAIQKEVDVPIVATANCQTALQATRLGTSFQLDTTSFMCAGGEAQKDACTGDGGAPLVCQVGVQWYVVGLVAWGIGCGTNGVPGVYINVANYISWIQQTVRS